MITDDYKNNYGDDDDDYGDADLTAVLNMMIRDTMAHYNPSGSICDDGFSPYFDMDHENDNSDDDEYDESDLLR